jgi:hypothetical protein
MNDYKNWVSIQLMIYNIDDRIVLYLQMNFKDLNFFIRYRIERYIFFFKKKILNNL